MAVSTAVRKLCTVAVFAAFTLASSVALAQTAAPGGSGTQAIPPTTPTQTTPPTQPSLSQSAPEQRRPEQQGTDRQGATTPGERTPAAPMPPTQPEDRSAPAPTR
jgi:hypothetical protein